MKYQVLYSKEARNVAIVKRYENGASKVDYRFIDVVVEDKLFVPFEDLYYILQECSKWEEGYDLVDDEILFQSNNINDVVNWLINNLWIYIM